MTSVPIRGRKCPPPVGAGQPLGYPHPGTGLIVPWGVSGLAGGSSARAGLQQAAGRWCSAALPGELDTDAVIAIGGQYLIGQANDMGNLGPGRRPGQDWGNDRLLGRLGQKGIVVCAMFDIAHVQQGRGLRSQVVGAGMIDGQYLETGIIAEVRPMLAQRDDCSFSQLTDCAVCSEASVCRFLCCQGEIGA